ncbi:unnamed protein product [Parnassius apollo]|uniref:(apollo) hypothetical protein n=1 Tax=Parnassius apollo TaxID=110799 RepID=A0A8S3W904_PARAO|nr:unnamed protein product [Parnassius apollo]
MEHDFAKQEQWARQQNVEIVGVPEKSNECLMDVLTKIAEKASQKIFETDVDFVHRVKPQRSSNKQPRPIIARFK